MKSKKIISGILILVVLGCIIWFFRLDRFGLSAMKWVDMISYDGEKYEGVYTDDDSRVLVKEELLDKKLGKIKFKLEGNVRNPYYKMRNLDATILDKGTLIYSLDKVDTKEMIALKIGDNFYLYINNELDN